MVNFMIYIVIYMIYMSYIYVIIYMIIYIYYATIKVTLNSKKYINSTLRPMISQILLRTSLKRSMSLFEVCLKEKNKKYIIVQMVC